MNASQIIDAFGGIGPVADVTGASRSAVSNWRRDGIPARYWFALLDVARRKRMKGVTRVSIAWRPGREA